jgi:hypothetical protein
MHKENDIAMLLVYVKAIAKKLNVTQDELLYQVELLKEIKEAKADETKPQTDSAAEYKSVEDAPEWKIVFKVNTSEGISTQKIIQRAWTEKQAIFLGRTEQLFPTMNELVKAKQIQAKWNVLESEAEKIAV